MEPNDQNGAGSQSANQQSSDDGSQLTYGQLLSKYNGLRGYVDRTLKPKLEQLETDMAAQAEAHETEAAQLRSQLSIATKDLKIAEVGLKDALGNAENLSREKTVRDLIDQKYPGLRKAYTKGVLRVDGLEGDELEAYLSDFAEFSGQEQQEALDDALEGSTPPAPQGTAGGETLEDLSDKLFSMTPDDPKYEATEKAYLEAVRASQAS